MSCCFKFKKPYTSDIAHIECHTTLQRKFYRMSNILLPKKTWFKVVGHRPFDNNCMSTNLVNAASPEEAKQSMIDFYGFRNEDDDDKRKPNVIVDEVTPVMKS